MNVYEVTKLNLAFKDNFHKLTHSKYTDFFDWKSTSTTVFLNVEFTQEFGANEPKTGSMK